MAAMAGAGAQRRLRRPKAVAKADPGADRFGASDNRRGGRWRIAWRPTATVCNMKMIPKLQTSPCNFHCVQNIFQKK